MSIPGGCMFSSKVTSMVSNDQKAGGARAMVFSRRVLQELTKQE
jgi:hypothetical protein